MTMERFHEPEGSKRHDPEHTAEQRLAELRRRSQEYGQAARDAIARARAQGIALRQLENLKNVGGQ